MILNYLLENSELCAIIKSIRNLEKSSSGILKTVVDWTWFKFKEIKNNVYTLSKNLFQEQSVFYSKLEQAVQNNMKFLMNLLHIYEVFIELNKTADGKDALKKSKMVLQSFELYCEHLCLCIEHSLLPEIIGDYEFSNLFILNFIILFIY